MDTPQTHPNPTTPTTTQKVRPFGGIYGMIVGGLVAASWASPTGNPAVIATSASIGATLGAIGGHLLVSRLKPNRTMING